MPNARFAFTAVVLSALLAVPAIARADISLAVEAGPQLVLGDAANGDSTVGFGIAGRVGYSLKLPLLKLTPELKVAYDHLPIGFGGGASIKADTILIMAGARVSLGALLSPVAFAHIGYGTCSGSEGGIEINDCNGLAYDVGAGLDFTLIPLLDIGVGVAYNTLARDGAIHWLSANAQISLTF